MMDKSNFILSYRMFIAEGRKLEALKCAMDNRSERVRFYNTPKFIEVRGLKEIKQFMDIHDTQQSGEVVWKFIKGYKPYDKPYSIEQDIANLKQIKHRP